MMGSENDIGRKSNAKVLTSFASRGSIGKTILIGNLGGALADMGMRVLLIDADSHGLLTEFYKRKRTAEHALTQFITTQDSTGCISLTDIEGLEIICNDDFNTQLSDWLKASPRTRSGALRDGINTLRNQYDYILVDCKGKDVAGEIGELAVRASDMLLSPLPPDAMVVQEYLTNAMDVLKGLQPLESDTGNSKIPTPHICIFRHKVHNTVHCEFVGKMREMLSVHQATGKVKTLRTEIARTEAYAAAQSRLGKMPVHRIDHKTCSGQTLPTAYESMVSLTHELFPELKPLMPRISSDQQRPLMRSSEQMAVYSHQYATC